MCPMAALVWRNQPSGIAFIFEEVFLPHDPLLSRASSKATVYAGIQNSNLDSFEDIGSLVIEPLVDLV